MSEYDKTMVRLLIRGFTILSNLVRCFNAPKGMDDIITFASRNLERVGETDNVKGWKGVRLKRSIPIDTLSRLGVELLWMANKLNVSINHLRSAMGRMQINFEDEAKAYNIEVEQGKKDVRDRS